MREPLHSFFMSNKKKYSIGYEQNIWSSRKLQNVLYFKIKHAKRALIDRTAFLAFNVWEPGNSVGVFSAGSLGATDQPVARKHWSPLIYTGLLEDTAGWARTECTLILTSSRFTTTIVRCRVPQEKKIVREYKVILNAVTSVAVDPTFHLRELFVCFGGSFPMDIILIGHKCHWV